MYDYPLEPRTIGHTLAGKAEGPFLCHLDRTAGYADAHRLTNQYAHAFAAAGIGRGDHVALMLPNRPELLWAPGSLGKLGAPGVPLNTAVTGELPTSPRDQSDSRLLCTTDERRERGRRVAEGGPGVREVIGMVPCYLEVVERLPEAPSEKIEKYKPKQDAADRLDRLWGREPEGGTVRRS